MTQSDHRSGDRTAPEQFEQQLRSLLQTAHAEGITLEGGYDVDLDDESYDLSIEITRVARSE